MTTTALKTIGLGKTYGAIHALKDVSLEITTGSVLALLGENGAGKSTFISLVSGANSPTSGSIEIGGENVRLSSPHDAARRGVAVVHQEPQLANEASIAENILLATYANRRATGLVRPRDMARVAREHLEALGLTEGLPKVTTPAHRLSAAQRQLVAIAKAMASDVEVLFLDEPNSSLTPRETTRLWDLVRGLRDRGVAVVVVSHRLTELYQVVDRIAVLRDGELVGTGSAAEIPLARAVEMMARRSAGATAATARDRVRGPEVLRLKNVSTRSVHDINLVVHAGEVIGLAGLVGSGRTEIGRAICSADTVLAGRVTMAGKAVRFRSPRAALRAGIAMTSEERRRAAFVSHDVAFNISASFLPRMARFGFVTRRVERRLAGEWIDRLHLRGKATTPISSLSGGNQQKALISRSLAAQPRLVVFDEPTHGIDVATKAEIATLIRSLADDGLAVILISSEVEELVGIADRVAVVRGGRIVREAVGDDGLSLVAAALGEDIPPILPRKSPTKKKESE
jgi:ABC-type sugar transport system ATPase subunit